MRAQVLAAHPEIRQLYGAQPLQLIAVVLLFCARWGLAWLLRDASLLIIGLLASSVGVWIVHAAGTYAHESAHRLIVRHEPAALMVDLFIEATMTSFGKMVGYQYRHVNFHHLYLGDYEWDSEMRDVCAHVAVVRMTRFVVVFLCSDLQPIFEYCMPCRFGQRMPVICSLGCYWYWRLLSRYCHAVDYLRKMSWRCCVHACWLLRRQLMRSASIVSRYRMSCSRSRLLYFRTNAHGFQFLALIWVVPRRTYSLFSRLHAMLQCGISWVGDQRCLHSGPSLSRRRVLMSSVGGRYQASPSPFFSDGYGFLWVMKSPS